jgi:uncharacterized protein YegL
MFDPTKFTTKAPKPLPVVLLLDVSGSMTGDKIDNLNKAVKDMLDTFVQEEKMEIEIWVSIIKFGPVKLHLPFTKASQIKWKDLEVIGDTPLGGALKMAKNMIEDKETTPSRAYRPTVVLVSDGMPTDSWKKAMDDFIHIGRSSKCDRMAMAIGSDADKDVLSRFIEGTQNKLFKAQNANQIHEFFQRVTMSVTMRTRSQNPNNVPDPTDIKLDGKSAVTGKKGNTDGSTGDEGYW